MRRIRINWLGPYSIKDIKKLTNDEEDCGLYQVYGHHVVFGANSLLYVGITTARSFAWRFEEHQREWLHEENDVSIRLGRIPKEDYKDEPPEWPDWKTVVKDAEALLIYWHSPPYNAQNLSDYCGQSLRIQNVGNRGSLVPECSSDWKPQRPKADGDAA